MKKTLIITFSIILLIVIFLIWSQDIYNCPKDEGRDKCIIEYIESSGKNITPLICEEISNRSEKDICNFKFGLEGNLESCSKIRNINASRDLRDFCHFELGSKGDLEACSRIVDINESTYSRDLCYFELGSKGDLEACSRIVDVNDSIYSRDFCYFNIALGKRNLDSCAFIETPSLRESCAQSLN